MTIRDSGTRDTFNTGAVRDGQTGKGFYDCLPYEANRRIALIYEGGAKKYDKHNCRKGMPLSRLFDSAKRHLDKAIARMDDEDHLAMAAWNIGEAMELLYRIQLGVLPKKLDDVPNFYAAPCQESVREISAEITNEFTDKFRHSVAISPITAYLSHPIRGKNGANATPAEINANNTEAKNVARAIRAAAKNMDLYCPAEHDEVISILYRRGQVPIEHILQADCEILAKKEVLIVYCPNYTLSSGMLHEIDFADAHKIPVLFMSNCSHANLTRVCGCIETIRAEKL